MATLTLQNVPPAVLADLAARAARANRTVEEEVLAVIEGRSAPVATGERPSPPSGLQYIPSPEIPAPFDLKPLGPGVPVVPRKCGASRLEFWFDEDKVAE